MNDLRDTLDDALAPDDPAVRFIGVPASCTIQGCDTPATVYVLIGDGEDVAEVTRCAAHSDDRWRISDDLAANWATHKLAAERRALADIDTLYQSELDRLNAWRDHERTAHARQAEFFEHHLIAYVMGLRAQDPPGKERSRHALPGGAVRFTRSQSVQVDDSEALLDWAATQHQELIDARVAVSRLRDSLQKDGQGQLVAVTRDGEPVPGIRIEKRLTSKVETT